MTYLPHSSLASVRVTLSKPQNPKVGDWENEVLFTVQDQT